MLNRIDQASVGDTLSNLLLACREDIQGLKNRQLVSGDSGVIYYPTETTNIWDYQETVTNVTVRVRVRHSGDGSQQYPIVSSASEVAVQFGIGALIPLANDFASASSGGNSVTAVIDLDATDAADTTGRTTWLTRLVVTGTAKLYLKAHVYGSSAGSLEVVRVS